MNELRSLWTATSKDYREGLWNAVTPNLMAVRQLIEYCEGLEREIQTTLAKCPGIEANIKIVAERQQRMADALEAVLLFHGVTWGDASKDHWQTIALRVLGNSYERIIAGFNPDSLESERVNAPYEATTRVLCDMVRAALKKGELGPC